MERKQPFLFSKQPVTLLFVALAAILISAPAQTQTQTQRPKNHTRPFVTQEVFANYWTIEPGWNTHFEIRNNRPDRNIDVEITINTADGTQASLGTVTAFPNEVADVDLSALVAARKPQLLTSPVRYGSASFKYVAQHSHNLYIGIMIHRMGLPISFHLDAVFNVPEWGASTEESIWWLPKETADGFVIVSNLSPRAANVRLNAWGSRGVRRVQRALKIESGNTERVTFRDLLRDFLPSDTYGGLQVTVDGDASAVHVSEIVFDETIPFSAILKVFRRDPSAHQEDQAVRAPLVAMKQPDPTLGLPQGTVLKPMVFLRNTSGATVKPKLQVSWHAKAVDGKSVQDIDTLAPFETRVIDLSQFQKPGMISPDALWSTVTLSYPGRAHDLVAVQATYDDSGQYGVQSPFTNNLSSKWMGGQWRVDATHNSLITTGNAGNKPARVAVTLFYNRGRNRYDMPEQELPPGGQLWIDVGKLIRERTPDKNGNPLPLDVASGGYTIEDLADRAVGYLFESKVITDKTYGHAMYGCGGCCNVPSPAFDESSTWIELDPTGLLKGDSTGFLVKGTDACTGQEVDLTGSSWGWVSTNTSIATVDYTTVTGVNDGTAYVQSAVTVRKPQGDSCVVGNMSQDAQVNVAPSPIFNIEYSAYIPVDHVTAPSTCFYGGAGYFLLYRGDANRGTFRTREIMTLAPDAHKAYGFLPSTGETKNYGYGSPANGVTLSSADDDGVGGDCYLYNDFGKADPSGFQLNTAFPASHQGSVQFYGSSANPLEYQWFAIEWNETTTVDDSNPSISTASVSYDFTCYPAHQVKVNGNAIFVYTPPSNSVSFITQCLSHTAPHVSGSVGPIQVQPQY